MTEEIKKSSYEDEEAKFKAELGNLLKKVIKQGQLIVCGTKQTGKTNATMWLMRVLMETKAFQGGKIKIRIFDLPLVWRYRFDGIPYFTHGLESKYIPEDVNAVIVDIPYVSADRTKRAVLDALVEEFWRKRSEKEKLEGKFKDIAVYVLEECQNVFGSYALSGSEGKIALKIFSECANYGIVVIGTTQRLSDVSTKIVERSQYLLIGRLTGDNDLRKIRRVTNKVISERVKELKRGEFIFWDRDEPEMIARIYFPQFQRKGEAYPLFREDQAGIKHFAGFYKREYVGEV